MAPLYDLYNHRNGKSRDLLVPLMKVRISIIAGRDISAGEHHCLPPIGEGTLELFRDYGFGQPSAGRNLAPPSVCGGWTVASRGSAARRALAGTSFCAARQPDDAR